MLLRKARSYAEIYNDLDSEIVNFFRVARDHGNDLARLLQLTPFSREEFSDAYRPSEDPVERARQTAIKSFMGFGSDSIRHPSGFRASTRRSATIPAHDWSNYGFAVRAVTDRLQGVVIEHRDAVDVIAAHDSPTTLHYIDPPYVHATRTKGKGYRHELTDNEHRRLAAALRACHGKVIVSGYQSGLYDALFAGWRRLEFPTFADGARPRMEVLWLNFQSTGPLPVPLF